MEPSINTPTVVTAVDSGVLVHFRTGHDRCDASFNPSLYQLTLLAPGREERIELGFAGSRLLERLLQAPGEVVSREELMAFAWTDRVVGQGSLNQQIYTLRQLLGDEKARSIIQTLPRRGYLFNPENLLAAPPSAAQPQAELEQPVPASATLSPVPNLSILPVKPSTRRASAWLGGTAAILTLGAVSLPAVPNWQKHLVSQELTTGPLHEVFVAREPIRVQRLISESRKLSRDLAALASHPLEVIHSSDGEYHKLWCRNPDGGRWVMIHRTQLNNVAPAVLRKCLS